MLGRLLMTMDECIEQYSRIIFEILHRKSLLSLAFRKGKISSRHATAVLEKSIKQMIHAFGESMDLPLIEVDPPCKV